MNKAQKYLLDNNLDDLVINTKEKDYKKLIYVSDIMMSFKNECPHCKAGRVSFDTYDKELKCWVTNTKACDSCKGTGEKE